MSDPHRCVEHEGTCGMSNTARDPDGRWRCLSHSTDPARVARRAERNLRGGLNRLRVLPSDTRKPDLASPQGIRRELRELIHAVKVGLLAPEPAKVAILGLGVAVKLGELEIHASITALRRQLERQLDRRRLHA